MSLQLQKFSGRHFRMGHCETVEWYDFDTTSQENLVISKFTKQVTCINTSI